MQALQQLRAALVRLRWSRQATDGTVFGMTRQLPSPLSASQPTCLIDNLNRTSEMRFISTPRGARLTRRLAAHRLDVWGIPYGTDPHE